MEKLKTLLQKEAILMIIMSLFIMIIHQFNYKGLVFLGLATISISIMKLVDFYYKKNNKTQPKILAILLLTFAISFPAIFNDDVTEHLIHQGERQQLCGIIHHIEQSSLFDDYFYLANHDMKFNLNQHKKAKIDDKVCITFNPNQKWLGYAYIFKVETQ